MTAAGIVAGASLTSVVVAKFGDKLPMLTNADGSKNVPASIGYSILIPGITGLLARRYSRTLSDGLILGGLAWGALAAIAAYAPPETKAMLGFSEYLDAGARPMRPLAASLNGAGAGGAFRGSGSVLGSASPFKATNW